MSDRPPASTPVKTKSPTDRPTLSIELCPAPLDGAQLAANFADIVATASSLGQSAIGYRRAVSGQIVVNPSKSERLRLDRSGGHRCRPRRVVRVGCWVLLPFRLPSLLGCPYH